MYRIAFLFLFTAFPAYAADMSCSIHVAQNSPETEYTKLAKITQTKAQEIALASFKAAPKYTVVDGELEVEKGCLIYSFDIRLPRTQGVEEIMVDAGTGAILSQNHESVQQEMIEQDKDKAGVQKSP